MQHDLVKFVCADGPWRGQFLWLDNEGKTNRMAWSIWLDTARRTKFKQWDGRYVQRDNKRVSLDNGATRTLALYWEPYAKPTPESLF